MRRLAGEQAGVRVHMHNDFGLGVANTLAGIEAGADWVEVTVNGLGERAGNCPLEELVVALEALYGIQVGVRTESLFILCKLVEQMSGVAIAPMQPVVGGDVFSNKLEIHVKAASTDPTLMEPYDPAVVGNRRTIRLGRGTGPTGVLMKLQELNLALPAELIDTAVQRVNQRAVANKKGVSDSEFRQLVGELGGAT
jgi:isopropylmalate/homocitrate/citramalate synthase